jgi:uncharacterized protein YyaL (SSP411 family)
MNRLADQRSPYLLHHAADPVDWTVWGPEAFAEARERGVPVFLSSGYDACHWCHVLQRESFRDPETAAYLNEHFVPVKVDRELRPDVDATYMDYVVATTGSGGWPLTVFLDGDGFPLFGGTYFPPKPVHGMPSFREVLESVVEAWGDPGMLARMRTQVEAFMYEQARPVIGDPIDAAALETATENLLTQLDQVWGGFGKAPKFPQAPAIIHLAAYQGFAPDRETAFALDRTMSSMLRGGIYDQVGGGLMRYAVDETWLVPHFEKMLYDQGLLLRAIAAASTAVGPTTDAAQEWAWYARSTAAFMRAELLDDSGMLAASLSADSEGLEGAYYVWEHEELARVLDPVQLELAAAHLGVTPAGNWHGRTIITRREGRDASAAAVDQVLARLAAERATRVRPDTDTKLLASWNAIAARGLLEVGAILDDDELVGFGLDVLRATLARCDDGAGGFVHAVGDPSVRDIALAEDHAHLAAAALSAFEATDQEDWLGLARDIHAGTLARFAVEHTVFAADGATGLPVRPYDADDQPVPSAASTAAENAARLWAITGEEPYAAWAEEALRRHSDLARYAPGMAAGALAAADVLVGGGA